MTASPKPSVRAPWRVGDAMVGTENAGWTTPKRGPTAHNDLPQKRLEMDLCWIICHVSPSPWQPNQWRDWTELVKRVLLWYDLCSLLGIKFTGHSVLRDTFSNLWEHASKVTTLRTSWAPYVLKLQTQMTRHAKGANWNGCTLAPVTAVKEHVSDDSDEFDNDDGYVHTATACSLCKVDQC